MRTLKTGLIFLAVCIVSVLLPCVKTKAASKVSVTFEFSDGTKKTWKTGDKPISIGKKTLLFVYFGSYPQSEVTGKALTKKIVNADYDENGVATVGKKKYMRISKDDALFVNQISTPFYYDWADKEYAYFAYEPIKWRVLKSESGTLLLMSEYGLDTQQYNTVWDHIIWKNCSLRTWLNNDFLTTAFTAKEQKKIKTIKHKDAVEYARDNYTVTKWSTTKDKVYLLSNEEYNEILEATPTSYYITQASKDYLKTLYPQDNFDVLEQTVDRFTCRATDYACALGVYIHVDHETYGGIAFSIADGIPMRYVEFWLRTCGIYSTRGVGTAGMVSCLSHVEENRVTSTKCAVRPSITLNVSEMLK